MEMIEVARILEPGISVHWTDTCEGGTNMNLGLIPAIETIQ